MMTEEPDEFTIEPPPPGKREPTLNIVHEVLARPQPDVYIVRCNITDIYGETYDTDYASLPDDPYGLGPTVRQWLADNPDFPITPYTPPTPDEVRAAMLPITRLEFRNGMSAAGVNTAKIEEYLAQIDDPAEQEQQQIYWEETQYFQRLDTFVVDLGAYVGMTPEQLDDVFTGAIA